MAIKKGATPSTGVLFVRAPSALIRAAAKAAKANDESLARFVRRAIEKALEAAK